MGKQFIAAKSFGAYKTKIVKDREGKEIKRAERVQILAGTVLEFVAEDEPRVQRWLAQGLIKEHQATPSPVLAIVDEEPGEAPSGAKKKS